MRNDEADTPLMTIGDCREGGRLLEIGCLICGQRGYYTHEQVNLPAHLSFALASRHLICAMCGARNLRDPQWPIWMRPDARGPRKDSQAHPSIIDRPGRDWYQQEKYLGLPINSWLANVRCC